MLFFYVFFKNCIDSRLISGGIYVLIGAHLQTEICFQKIDQQLLMKICIKITRHKHGSRNREPDLENGT